MAKRRARRKRYVDERDVRRNVRSAVQRTLAAAGVTLDDDGIAPGTAKRLAAWLRAQPTIPRLVGATAAAKLLGVQPPHLARLRAQGRMPDPIPVEGSAGVYLQEEIEALAAKLEAERRARVERRKAKEEAA